MKKPSPAQWKSLLLILSVLLGGWLRFLPTILGSDVINDGGMFFNMAQDLRENRYFLPKAVSYNELGIPYAYPPLPFYLTALLSDWFRLPLGELFRWLPAFVSTLSILAFYLLGKTVLKSETPAILATTAFALIPRSFSWFVMGGGVSRTLGQVFLLLTVWSVYNVFTRKERIYLLWASIFGALVTLSHPGQLLHTIAICIFLWLYIDRREFLRAASVALGVALLTSPWWLAVLIRNGPGAFLAVAQTGNLSALFWLPLLTPSFAEEQFITLITITGFLGFAVCLLRRDYLLPLWMLFPFAVDPRSASSIVIFPLAMLAGIGLNDLIIPGLVTIGQESNRPVSKTPQADWSVLFNSHRSVRILIGYFVIASLISAYSYARILSRYTVPESSKEAMAWVRKNIPPDSTFLLLTGAADPFSDPVQEWFPVFSERISLTTIQGREWSLGTEFINFHNEAHNLQRCLNVDPVCVEQWAAALDLTYDYLYLIKTPVPAVGAGFQNPALLSHLLRTSLGYELVYESSQVEIFARLSASP